MIAIEILGEQPVGDRRWQIPKLYQPVEAQLADALLKKKQMGYPLEYLMELDGMDPLDIERVLEMREKELQDPQVLAALRGLDDSGSGGGSVSGAAADNGADGE